VTGAVAPLDLEPIALASQERTQPSAQRGEASLWKFRGVVWNERQEPLELFGVVATRVSRSHEVLERLELPLEQRAGGRFELANHAPGHWEVAPFAPDRVLVHKRIFRERDASLMPYLLIRNSEPLEFDPDTALVSGTVLDSSGEPPEKAVVTAYRTPLDEWDSARFDFELAPVAAGKFSLRLEPGQWTFVAQAKGWNDSGETEVTLSAGQVLTGLSLQLESPT
jgi:nitrogen fixation protein FixH